MPSIPPPFIPSPFRVDGHSEYWDAFCARFVKHNDGVATISSPKARVVFKINDSVDDSPHVDGRVSSAAVAAREPVVLASGIVSRGLPTISPASDSNTPRGEVREHPVAPFDEGLYNQSMAAAVAAIRSSVERL